MMNSTGASGTGGLALDLLGMYVNNRLMQDTHNAAEIALQENEGNGATQEIPVPSNINSNNKGQVDLEAGPPPPNNFRINHLASVKKSEAKKKRGNNESAPPPSSANSNNYTDISSSAAGVLSLSKDTTAPTTTYWTQTTSSDETSALPPPPYTPSSTSALTSSYATQKGRAEKASGLVPDKAGHPPLPNTLGMGPDQLKTLPLDLHQPQYQQPHYTNNETGRRPRGEVSGGYNAYRLLVWMALDMFCAASLLATGFTSGTITFWRAVYLILQLLVSLIGLSALYAHSTGLIKLYVGLVYPLKLASVFHLLNLYTLLTQSQLLQALADACPEPFGDVFLQYGMGVQRSLAWKAGVIVFLVGQFFGTIWCLKQWGRVLSARYIFVKPGKGEYTKLFVFLLSTLLGLEDEMTGRNVLTGIKGQSWLGLDGGLKLIIFALDWLVTMAGSLVAEDKAKQRAAKEAAARKKRRQIRSSGGRRYYQKHGDYGIVREKSDLTDDEDYDDDNVSSEDEQQEHPVMKIFRTIASGGRAPPNRRNNGWGQVNNKKLSSSSAPASSTTRKETSSRSTGTWFDSEEEEEYDY